MDFDGALRAHNDWKVKLRAAITSRQKIDAGALGRDNVCPLGTWLHGEAKGRFGNLPAYQTCVADHAAFHREAARVAQAINAERFSEAEHMLDAGSMYASVTTKVGVSIIALRKATKL